MSNPIWRSLTANSERSDIRTAEAIWQTLSAKSSTALHMAMRESATPALTIPVAKFLGVGTSIDAELSVTRVQKPYRHWYSNFV